MKNLAHYFKSNDLEGNSPESNSESVLSDEIKPCGSQMNKHRKNKRSNRVKTTARVSIMSPDKTVEANNSSAEEFENANGNVEIVKMRELWSPLANKCTSRTSDVEVHASKINAFQLMMENRNKNSERCSPEGEKEEEKKAGLKRKRSEEDAKKTVRVKLEKKAEGFKSKRKKLVVSCEPDNREEQKENSETQRCVNLVEMTTLDDHTQKNVLAKCEKPPVVNYESDIESESTIIKVKMFSPKKNLQDKKIKKHKRRSKLSLVQVKEIVEQAYSTAQLFNLKDNAKCSEQTVDTDGCTSDIVIIDESSQENSQKQIKQERTIKNATNDNVTNNTSSETNNSLRRSTRIRTQKKQIVSYNSEVDIEILFSDDEEKDRMKEVKKHAKLAPIFLKNSPKPLPDPAVIEARRNFLLSGIPESLKKTVVKQNR